MKRAEQLDERGDLRGVVRVDIHACCNYRIERWRSARVDLLRFERTDDSETHCRRQHAAQHAVQPSDLRVAWAHRERAEDGAEHGGVVRGPRAGVLRDSQDVVALEDAARCSGQRTTLRAARAIRDVARGRRIEDRVEAFELCGTLAGATHEGERAAPGLPEHLVDEGLEVTQTAQVNRRLEARRVREPARGEGAVDELEEQPGRRRGRGKGTRLHDQNSE